MIILKELSINYSLIFGIIFRLCLLQPRLNVWFVNDVSEACEADSHWEHHDGPPAEEKDVPWDEVPLDHNEIGHVLVGQDIEAFVPSDDYSDPADQKHWHS